VGLVLGVAALVRPLAASARVFYTAIPMVLVAALLFWFVTIDKSVARGVGGGLVAAFATAMAVLFGLARREPEAVKEELAGWVPERFAVRWAVLLAFAGLAATLGGATLAADRLYPVGRAILNVAVLGETLVAFATALPAVGAAAVAARRGRANLALGVVVGFVLCNLLLALGAAALVQPLPLTRHAIAQEIPAVALFTALLLLVLVRLTVPRWAGGLLVAGYAGFVVWQLLRVPPR
jgi:cation:H+ antiporter